MLSILSDAYNFFPLYFQCISYLSYKLQTKTKYFIHGDLNFILCFCSLVFSSLNSFFLLSSLGFSFLTFILWVSHRFTQIHSYVARYLLRILTPRVVPSMGYSPTLPHKNKNQTKRVNKFISSLFFLQTWPYGHARPNLRKVAFSYSLSLIIYLFIYLVSCLFVWVCVYLSVHTYHCMHVKSENSLWELAYSFHLVDTRDGVMVVRLVGKHWYLHNHVASPIFL